MLARWYETASAAPPSGAGRHLRAQRAQPTLGHPRPVRLGQRRKHRCVRASLAARHKTACAIAWCATSCWRPRPGQAARWLRGGGAGRLAVAVVAEVHLGAEEIWADDVAEGALRVGGRRRMCDKAVCIAMTATEGLPHAVVCDELAVVLDASTQTSCCPSPLPPPFLRPSPPKDDRDSCGDPPLGLCREGLVHLTPRSALEFVTRGQSW